MEHTYAPWRDAYIQDNQVSGCVFCHIAAHAELDRSHHVLFRTQEYFFVMNKYPYTPGHFMMIPHVHTDAIETLEASLWQAMSTHIPQAVALLKEVLGAKGVNIGMNLGHAAGAGIAEHIHMHFVPRWEKDTNFMTTIAQTRVYSMDFDALYEKLYQAVPRYFIKKESHV